MKRNLIFIVILLVLAGCDGLMEVDSGNDTTDNSDTTDSIIDFAREFPSLFAQFSATLDFDNVYEYNNESWPSYINEDNTGSNPITNSGALLGRVLFYDVNLSSDNSTSCASCHQQAFAFGDSQIVSTGANGLTGRHSMRLVNARFAEEETFFLG